MALTTVPSAFAALAAELPPLASPADLTRVLGIPKNTQNDWRSKGRGPKFLKIGRAVRYRREEVIEWLESQEYASTAEVRKAGER